MKVPTSLAGYRHGIDPWALVTGASDGIGFAFANELCASGFNVVLHGRNPTKLETVSTQLRNAYPHIQTRLYIADAGSTEFSPEELLRAVEGLRITILINNIGGTASLSRDFKTFQNHTHAEIDALININARFTTHVTRDLLPSLHSNGPSLILNVGSNACVGIPYLSVYSGTKGHLISWSRALSAELKSEGSNVVALGLLVGSVQSQQNKSPVSFFTPSSETMARAALGKVGTRRAVVTGYWPHAMQSVAVSWLPEGLAQKVMAGAMKPLAEGRRTTW